jgi:hypothetical protein
LRTISYHKCKTYQFINITSALENLKYDNNKFIGVVILLNISFLHDLFLLY